MSNYLGLSRRGKAYIHHNLIETIKEHYNNKPLNNSLWLTSGLTLDIRKAVIEEVLTKSSNVDIYEKDKATIKNIKKNIPSLLDKDKVRIINNDITRYQLAANLPDGKLYDFIFFDFMGTVNKNISQWLWENSFNEFISPNGIVVFTFTTNTRGRHKPFIYEFKDAYKKEYGIDIESKTELMKKVLCYSNWSYDLDLLWEKEYRDNKYTMYVTCFKNLETDTFTNPDAKLCAQFMNKLLFVNEEECKKSKPGLLKYNGELMPVSKVVAKLQMEGKQDEARQFVGDYLDKNKNEIKNRKRTASSIWAAATRFQKQL